MTTQYTNQNEGTKKGVGFPQLSDSGTLWLWRYKASQMGFSVAKLAHRAGVRKDAVSHFFKGRADRAGKKNVKAIKKALVELGIVERKKRATHVFNQAGLTSGTLRMMSRDLAKARKIQTASRQEPGRQTQEKEDGKESN